jgi:hypothetical protein
MIFFKLGFLTCAFYAGMTVIFEAAMWAVAYFRGIGVMISGRHWGLILGAKMGAIFGAMWLISFSAAWWIVYLGLKSKFIVLPD